MLAILYQERQKNVNVHIDTDQPKAVIVSPNVRLVLQAETRKPDLRP
jgi:hypothetical protein